MKLIKKMQNHKSVKKFRSWDMSVWFYWYLALTFLIGPWRSTFSHDDSVYFKFAESLSHFNLNIHILNFAGAWPQSLLGAIVLQLPFSPIVLLNCLTWIVFGVLSYFFVRDHKDNLLLVLAFFSFPIFAQFGASYMPDMYLCLIFYFVFRWFEKGKKPGPIYLLTILLIAQYQTTAAFVFFWSIFMLLEKNKRGWHPLAATVAGAIIYAVLPKSGIQQFGFQIFFGGPLSAAQIIESFSKTIQLLLAVGLFLIPLFPIKPKRGYVITTAIMQFYAFAVVYLCSNDFVSSNVLFAPSLSKVFACFFVSLGVWGWSGFFSGIKKTDYLVRGALAATVVICLFDGFRGAHDLRYVMPLALAWFLIWIKSANLKNGLLGHSKRFVIAMTIVAVFLNLNNLETTEAKWNIAKSLMKDGNSARSIRVGGSWDLMNYEPECTESALKKAKNSGELTREHVIQKVPKTFEDEANPRFLVKQYSILGMKVPKDDESRGQNPTRILNYRVFGISKAVAAFDTGVFVAPWCLQ
jgi:hypothetical protein